MPKKSNKTEQVLRLITKSSDKDDTAREVQDAETENVSEELPEEQILEEPKEVFDGSTLESESVLENPSPLDSKNESVEKASLSSGLKKAREFVPSESSKKVHRIPAPIERARDIKIANLSELLVEELMQDVMKKLNVCDCSLCKADIMALTLNHVPQKYVTTEEGKQFMQLNMYRKQYETDIMSSLTRACVRVKGSPRHN